MYLFETDYAVHTALVLTDEIESLCEIAVNKLAMQNEVAYNNDEDAGVVGCRYNYNGAGCAVGVLLQGLDGDHIAEIEDSQLGTCEVVTAIEDAIGYKPDHDLIIALALLQRLHDQSAMWAKGPDGVSMPAFRERFVRNLRTINIGRCIGIMPESRWVTDEAHHQNHSVVVQITYPVAKLFEHLAHTYENVRTLGE